MCIADTMLSLNILTTGLAILTVMKNCWGIMVSHKLVFKITEGQVCKNFLWEYAPGFLR